MTEICGAHWPAMCFDNFHCCFMYDECRLEYTITVDLCEWVNVNENNHLMLCIALTYLVQRKNIALVL